MSAAVRPLLRVDGRIPFLALLQLIHCYLIWAALHDIAQQLSARYTIEYVFLVLTPVSMAFLWHWAFSVLGRTGRLVWIGAFAVWTLLLDYAAWNSIATGWTRTNGTLESSSSGRAFRCWPRWDFWPPFSGARRAEAGEQIGTGLTSPEEARSRRLSPADPKLIRGSARPQAK